MPLDSYITKPDFSRQIKQYSGTTATLSGITNILQQFLVKSIEIDTAGALFGNVLGFDGVKFLPSVSGGLSNGILSGMILSYNTGLTYNVSSGTYRFNGIIYNYTGGSVTIPSGNPTFSRFDVVYVTGDSLSNTYLLTGTATNNPTIPTLTVNQLQVGIISVPANFTGGTGSTTIQVTSDTVFEFYSNGAGTGIQRAGAGGNAQAPGNFSFAPSRDSRAFADDSIALGRGIQASGVSQTVVGQHNVPNTTDFFIVGYGANSGAKANAFRVNNSGNTFVSNKLFVTSIEVETTGASNNFALIYDSVNNKFKPQSILTTTGGITGITSAGTGNILLLSTVTNNTLVYKSISAGTNISISENNGTVVFNNTFTGITTATSLDNGVKVLFSSNTTNLAFATLSSQTPSLLNIISSSTGVILFSAATPPSSSSSGITTATSLGGGVRLLFSSDTSNLAFATLSSQTPSTLRIISSSTGLILFSAITSGGSNVTLSSAGTGNTLLISSVTNNNIVQKSISAGTKTSITDDGNGTITIATQEEVTGGQARNLALYRTSAAIVYSSFTDGASIEGLNIRLASHTSSTGRTYTVPDVSNNADFVMTQGYQIINGKKEFISGYTVGPLTSSSSNFIDNVYNLQYTNKSETIQTYNDSQGNKLDILNLTHSLKKLYNIRTTEEVLSTNGTNVGLYEEYQIKRSGGTDNDGSTNLSGTVIANAINYRSSIKPNNFVGGAHFISNASYSIPAITNVVNQYYELNLKGANNTFSPHSINSYRGISLACFATNPINLATVNEFYDIYVGKVLRLSGLGAPVIINRAAAIYVEKKNKDTLTEPSYDVLKRDIYDDASSVSVSYTNTPWSLFVEADRAYIGNTLVLASALTLTSVTRGAWLDIGPSQATKPHINFSSGTAPTSPQIGDLWWNGTQLYFRKDGSTNVDLLSNTSGVTSGITDGQNVGSGVQVYLSSGTGNLYFRTLSSATPSQLSITQSGNLVIFSSNTSGGSNVTLSSAGTGNRLLISSVTNNNIIQKSISAGTGMQITESNGTLIFVSTATGGTGSTLSGNYLPLSGGTVSGNTLFSNTIGDKGILVSNSAITFQELSGTANVTLKTDRLLFTTNVDVNILDTLSSGYMVIAPSPSGEAGKYIRVASNNINWEYADLSTEFLALTGGTVSGETIFLSGISATSIYNDYIDFNTGASITQNFGRLFFNGTEQTLSYYGEGITEIKVGQQLYSRVYNNTGAILTKGTAVKVTGATLGLPTVCPAIATDSGENTVIGLVASNIANNSQGLVINNGLISGITINNFVVGDLLYLSPVSAGTYVNSLTGYGFNIRTNLIGRVVATGTTTGQIYVRPQNEDSTLSLTSIERNILEGNAISTGVYEFTGLTTGSTNTTFNISPVRGWITYNTYQYATAPEVINVYYSGGTNLTTPFLTSNTQTYILLTSASTISYQTTFPTPQQRRENIYLGKLGHGTRTTILNVFSEPDSDISPLSQLRDVLTPIKLINDGVLVSANGANLNINTSSGILYGIGIGFATNQLNPNSLTINATTPTTFQYRTQTGGTGGAFTSTTTVDVGFYDLNGVRTAVGSPAKQATNQRIFMLQNGQFRIQYGQAKYTDLATAIAAVQTESFTTFQNFRDNAILIGVLSVRSDATALNNIAQAKFTFASKFGEVVGGTGGIATTTLQQAYDNSVTPEIVTNSAEGALTIKNGTGNPNNVTNLLEGVDSTDVTTSFIRADGTISGLTFLGDASNLTGVLSKTLLTRNIPVTSQVAQVGSFYLYDKITITSATASVTVTSITSDVSISSYTPSIKFFANTGVTVTFRNSTTLKTEGGLDAVISGSTYDSITFTYNNEIGRYFQTNINNYI